MELKKTITVESQGSNSRLDSYLTGQDFAELDFAPSRSYLQKLIAEQRITVNGKPGKAGGRLKTGDQIVITIPEPQPPELLAENIPLEIVYEDSDLLVVNKPQGMVVHPAEGNYSGTLVNALLGHCRDLSGINGCLRPGIVHRLDKMTSGLLMVAKNDFTHLALAEQIAQRTVLKQYLALVQGIVKENQGIINAPIARSPQDRKKMAVVAGGREARTRYQVLERLADKYTLLRVTLETGRTHQIRVHLQYLGFSVVADQTYSSGKNNFGLPGQFLHAALLEFTHPRSGERLHFEASLPPNMHQVLESLGSSNADI